MKLKYLEIVTPDVDATCSTLEAVHGVTFSEPVEQVGNARVASLEGGGAIGVRAPMDDAEQPVVRPFLETTALAAAIESASDCDAEIALPSKDIAGRGFAGVYVQGGHLYGLWQGGA